jgi:hypothetical protein
VNPFYFENLEIEKHFIPNYIENIDWENYAKNKRNGGRWRWEISGAQPWGKCVLIRARNG